jgi:hypothetical protein
MVDLVKVPFTCTYFPGRSRVGTLWSLYLTGFITYTYTTAAWEVEFLGHPRALAIFMGLPVAAIAILTIRRRWYLSSLTGFRFYEKDPDAIFQGFDLSEGFAATSVSARKLR